MVGCWVTAQACVCRMCGDLNNGLSAQFQWRKCALEVSCTWDVFTFLPLHHVVTLSLKCTVFEIWRYVGQKSPFSTAPLSFDAPCPAKPRKYPHKTLKLRSLVYILAADSRPMAYLHSYFCGGLRKTYDWYSTAKNRIMAVKGQFRASQGHWFWHQSKVHVQFPPVNVQ